MNSDEESKKAENKPAPASAETAAANSDVFTKQEELFTGGTSEMPS